LVAAPPRRVLRASFSPASLISLRLTCPLDEFTV
jgi:hypothetical protein